MVTNIMSDKMTSGKLLVVLAVALSLGVVHDHLFYGQIYGLNYPLFVAVFLGLYFGMERMIHGGWGKLNEKRLLLAGLSLFFGLLVMFRASATLTFFNIATSLFLLLMLVKMSFIERIRDLHLVEYLMTLFEVPLLIVVNFFDYLRRLSGLNKSISRHETFFAVLRGIVVAVPFLILFAILFASADMVFGKMLVQMFNLKIDISLIGHLLRIFIVSALCAGVFYMLTRNIVKKQKDEGAKAITGLGAIEISVVLAVINALFLFFILIQVTYLFGGADKVVEAGFTYATYARKGFFELLAVAVIAFFLLFIADSMMKKLSAQKSGLYRTVASLLSAQVLVIMASSFYRLMVYENAYGFSEQRFYSHSFTIWLGVVFLLFLYKLNFDRRENMFAFNVFVSVLVYVALLNFWNPDAFIVRQNVDRYAQTNKLDTNYWFYLSHDAFPAIIEAKDNFGMGTEPANKVKDVIESIGEREGSEFQGDWRSFNFSRASGRLLLMTDL